MKAVKNIALAALSMSLVGVSVGTSIHIHNDQNLISKLNSKLKKEEGINSTLRLEMIKQNLLIKKQEKEMNIKSKKINSQDSKIEKLKKQLKKEKERKELPLRRNNNKIVTNNKPKSEYFTVTAYSPNAESTGKSAGDSQYKVTASGNKVQEGISAACPRSIKFGTRIYIEGYGYRTCDDRGSAIGQNRLDLYFESTINAIKFGVKRLKVTIYD